MDEKNSKSAERAYRAVIDAINKIGLKYGEGGDMSVSFSMSGDDLNMDFLIAIDAERGIVRLLSPMPYRIPKERRVDSAVVIAQINYKIINGFFEYDIEGGTVMYKMNVCYRDSLISSEAIEYMILYAAETVEKNNDALFLFGKGALDFGDFFDDDDY